MVLTAAAIGLLLGTLLGLCRVNLLILVATLAIAVIGAAAVEITRSAWGTIGIVFVIASTIQGGYLGAAVLKAISLRTSPEDEASVTPAECRDLFEMILDIRDQMEVVGSDGRHVGIIDHKESPDGIILSKDDPVASGRPHLIWMDWVDHVDRKVHLNRPYRQATAEWLTA